MKKKIEIKKGQFVEIGIGDELWFNANDLAKLSHLTLASYLNQAKTQKLIAKSGKCGLITDDCTWLREDIALDFAKWQGSDQYTIVRELALAEKPINPKLHTRNEQIVVSSLDVADKFIKDHKNIIRDIQALECSDDFKQLNFELTNYVGKQGVVQPCYAITRDGFSFLVMGFTGKMAARFKEAYIKAFNDMEQKSNTPIVSIPKDYPSALRALADAEEARMIAEAAAEQNKEKAEGYELLIEKADNYSLKEAADLLGSGQNRFSKWLKTNGYLQRDGIPYQTYLRNQPYFAVKETIKNDLVYHTPMITPKGMDYFTKLRNRGQMDEILNKVAKTLDTNIIKA